MMGRSLKLAMSFRMVSLKAPLTAAAPIETMTGKSVIHSAYQYINMMGRSLKLAMSFRMVSLKAPLTAAAPIEIQLQVNQSHIQLG